MEEFMTTLNEICDFTIADETEANIRIENFRNAAGKHKFFGPLIETGELKFNPEQRIITLNKVSVTILRNVFMSGDYDRVAAFISSGPDFVSIPKYVQEELDLFNKDLPMRAMFEIKEMSFKMGSLVEKMHRHYGTMEEFFDRMEKIYPREKKGILQYLSGKAKLVGVLGGTIIVGDSLYEAFENYKKLVTGCIRMENKNGQIFKCKVLTNSCQNQIVNETLPACDPSLIPMQMRKPCNDKITCVSCMSADNNPKMVNRNIHYECLEPSNAEVLGHFVGHEYNQVVEIIKNIPKEVVQIATKSVSWISTVCQWAIAFVIFILVCRLGWYFVDKHD
uniref:Putative ORF43 n=1 Tax=Drosophila-associated filamentous virus TaxID=2743186 RepID=A0A6M9TZY5_9VIRU|nr:putative ORF43 [Drosophila-associated filamentous virus]